MRREHLKHEQGQLSLCSDLATTSRLICNKVAKYTFTKSRPYKKAVTSATESKVCASHSMGTLTASCQTFAETCKYIIYCINKLVKNWFHTMRGKDWENYGHDSCLLICSKKKSYRQQMKWMQPHLGSEWRNKSHLVNCVNDAMIVKRKKSR